MTPEPQTDGVQGLTPDHWIAIATIAVVVLGWGLSEPNARLANVESATNNIRVP